MANVKAQIEIDVVDRASAPVAKAEAAVKGLAAAELQAANASKVLATSSLEKAQAATTGAMSAEQLAKAEITAANASRKLAAAELQAAKASQTLAVGAKNAATATASIAPAAETAARSTGRISKEQKLAGLGMAQNINLVSELAMGFGNMSPVTRGLGLAFATAGNNAFALASSLGPMGVIIGTLVGIVPGLIGMFHALGEESDDAASSMDGARQSFMAMVDAQRSAREGIQGGQRLLEGEASTQELDDAIAVTRRLENEARRREAELVATGGGRGENANASFEQRLFNAYRQTDQFRAGNVSFDSVQAFAAEFQQRPGEAGRPIAGGINLASGIAAENLRALSQAQNRSFNEGNDETDASSGSVTARERLARLEERRQVAAERERREALEADAQAATSNVGVAQAEFDRQLDLAGVSPRRAQRLRSDLSSASGEADAIFRSSDLAALGDNRGAVEAAAERVRQQREIAERRQAEIRAEQLAGIDNERGAAVDATTRDLPGIGERADGGGASGIATRIAEAIRSDSEAAARAREPGRLEVTLLNANGSRIGAATVAEGDSTRLELDADGAGPDGLGPL